MHDPIDVKHRTKMRKLAQDIDKSFNGTLRGKTRAIGFALLIFELSENPFEENRMNYISNTERGEMIVAMKEFIAKWEGQAEISKETVQ